MLNVFIIFLQRAVEANCLRLYELFHKRNGPQNSRSLTSEPKLRREQTLKFLERGLLALSEGYSCLDASRPWLLYWILHSMEILGHTVDSTMAQKIVVFLGR